MSSVDAAVAWRALVAAASDPYQRAGKFACPGGQNDIQLSPDARWAVMAIDTKNNDCHNGQEGSVVLDISDPAHPREVAFIPIQVGSHYHFAETNAALAFRPEAGITPIATGRPGLMATRQNTNRPTVSTACRT